ncbi:MAG: tetratricopeptide repeat protein [Caldilineaceae bacterium]|nr:tetratricopeptide repeat protein [Caldilineaceae bacterium]
MAHSVRDHRDSPADQLRAALDNAEVAVLRLRPDQVEGFLLRLDQLETQFQALESGGLNLLGERTRQQSLINRLDGRPQLVTKPAAQVGGLAALRQKNPPASGEWWHLDAVEAAQRRHLLRRLLTSLGVIVGVILAVYIALTYVFPPDPNAVLSSGTSGQLPELIARGQWEIADKLIGETLSQMTVDDVELLIWQSVVAAHFDRQKEAADAFAKAKALAPADRQAVFWSTVGNVRLAAGDLTGATEAATEALAIDPNEAQAYFVIASVAEANGQVQDAIAAFEKAFDLAAESNPQLAVIARVRMGMLMQSGPPMDVSTTTVPAGP